MLLETSVSRAGAKGLWSSLNPQISFFYFFETPGPLYIRVSGFVPSAEGFWRTPRSTAKGFLRSLEPTLGFLDPMLSVSRAPRKKDFWASWILYPHEPKVEIFWIQLEITASKVHWLRQEYLWSPSQTQILWLLEPPGLEMRVYEAPCTQLLKLLQSWLTKSLFRLYRITTKCSCGPCVKGF